MKTDDEGEKFLTLEPEVDGNQSTLRTSGSSATENTHRGQMSE
jgi:hypothetical protein